MNDFLKGNFSVKKKIVEKSGKEETEKEALSKELKDRVLSSLGGSMVYVERTGLMWDGDDPE